MFRQTMEKLGKLSKRKFVSNFLQADTFAQRATSKSSQIIKEIVFNGFPKTPPWFGQSRNLWASLFTMGSVIHFTNLIRRNSTAILVKSPESCTLRQGFCPNSRRNSESLKNLGLFEAPDAPLGQSKRVLLVRPKSQQIPQH